MTYDSSLRFALKTGFLSFDSTRVSANDVGYPIDIAILKRGSDKIIEKRFNEDETGTIGEIWGDRLKGVIKDIPEDWIGEI